MSYSLSAGGTKEETLASLASYTGLSPDGQAALELVTKVVGEAAPEGADGRQVRFSVTAYGHSGPGQVPQMTVSITAGYAGT